MAVDGSWHRSASIADRPCFRQSVVSTNLDIQVSTGIHNMKGTPLASMFRAFSDLDTGMCIVVTFQNFESEAKDKPGS